MSAIPREILEKLNGASGLVEFGGRLFDAKNRKVAESSPSKQVAKREVAGHSKSPRRTHHFLDLTRAFAIAFLGRLILKKQMEMG